MLEIIIVLGICSLFGIFSDGCATLITGMLVIGLCALIISHWQIVAVGLVGLFLIIFIIAAIVDSIKGEK